MAYGTRIHKGPSIIPILSQIKSIPRIDTILIFSSHLGLGLPKYLFPVGVPLKIFKSLLRHLDKSVYIYIWYYLHFYEFELNFSATRITCASRGQGYSGNRTPE